MVSPPGPVPGRDVPIPGPGPGPGRDGRVDRAEPGPPSPNHYIILFYFSTLVK